MKKIVIIGAGEFQNPLILKAKEMGYETHVFAWADGSCGEKTADYFYPVSIVEREKILEECKRILPVAVVTIASDLANLTVQYLAERLGLTCNSEQCLLNSTNKYRMRSVFQENGVKTPQFAKVSVDSNLEQVSLFHFPVIVKPTDRSGSRGITKVASKEALRDAIEAAVENSFEKKAIVEEFIEGNEYSCECVSYQGKHHLLAITKKFTTGSPHFIETGHMEPAGLPQEMQDHVQREIFTALTALDIQFGASHAEFRIDSDGSIGIIEIGSRMGGDCIGSDLVKLSTGKDFVQMVIDIAAGKQPDLSVKSDPKAAVVRFIFDQSDLDILERIKKTSPEKIYFVSELQSVEDHKIVDSGTRCGFFILACDGLEQAQQLSGLQ